MVQGVTARRAAVMTVATSSRAKKTPMFSVNSASSQGLSGAGTQRLTTTAVSSQTPAASGGLRQLFGALSAAPVVAPVAPADPPFTPAFRSATGSTAVGADVQITWNLNSNYFATKETAQWIANKYGTGEVIEAPFAGAGGLFTASANEFHIKLKDGREVNAGILAGYYERNPPDKFPGLADKLIKNQLGLV